MDEIEKGISQDSTGSNVALVSNFNAIGYEQDVDKVADERRFDCRVPQLIPIELIDHHSDNPRLKLDKEHISALAAKIDPKVGFDSTYAIKLRRKANGRYEIVAGTNRTEAGREAGLNHIWAYVYEMSDLEALVALGAENHHKELGSLEYGRLALRVQETGEHGDLAALAKAWGLRRDALSRYVAAARVWTACSESCVNATSARNKGEHLAAVNSLPLSKWTEAATAIISNDLTVAESRELVKRLKAEASGVPETTAGEPSREEDHGRVQTKGDGDIVGSGARAGQVDDEASEDEADDDLADDDLANGDSLDETAHNREVVDQTTEVEEAPSGDEVREATDEVVADSKEVDKATYEEAGTPTDELPGQGALNEDEEPDCDDAEPDDIGWVSYLMPDCPPRCRWLLVNNVLAGIELQATASAMLAGDASIASFGATSTPETPLHGLSDLELLDVIDSVGVDRVRRLLSDATEAESLRKREDGDADATVPMDELNWLDEVSGEVRDLTPAEGSALPFDLDDMQAVAIERIDAGYPVEQGLFGRHSELAREVMGLKRGKLKVAMKERGLERLTVGELRAGMEVLMISEGELTAVDWIARGRVEEDAHHPGFGYGLVAPKVGVTTLVRFVPDPNAISVAFWGTRQVVQVAA